MVNKHERDSQVVGCRVILKLARTGGPQSLHEVERGPEMPAMTT